MYRLTEHDFCRNFVCSRFLDTLSIMIRVTSSGCNDFTTTTTVILQRYKIDFFINHLQFLNDMNSFHRSYSVNLELHFSGNSVLAFKLWTRIIIFVIIRYNTVKLGYNGTR